MSKQNGYNLKLILSLAKKKFNTYFADSKNIVITDPVTTNIIRRKSKTIIAFYVIT